MSLHQNLGWASWRRFYLYVRRPQFSRTNRSLIAFEVGKHTAHVSPLLSCSNCSSWNWILCAGTWLAFVTSWESCFRFGFAQLPPSPWCTHVCALGTSVCALIEVPNEYSSLAQSFTLQIIIVFCAGFAHRHTKADRPGSQTPATSTAVALDWKDSNAPHREMRTWASPFISIAFSAISKKKNVNWIAVPAIEWCRGTTLEENRHKKRWN